MIEKKLYKISTVTSTQTACVRSPKIFVFFTNSPIISALKNNFQNWNGDVVPAGTFFPLANFGAEADDLGNVSILTYSDCRHDLFLGEAFKSYFFHHRNYLTIIVIVQHWVHFLRSWVIIFALYIDDIELNLWKVLRR